MPDQDFLIKLSYIEIYNEKVYDLLEKSKPEIARIFENGDVSLPQKVVDSKEKMMRCFKMGDVMRRFRATKSNERLSRSHVVFQISIESVGIKSVHGSVALTLVDLAGSEPGNSAKTQTKSLNMSIQAFNNVIRTLSEGKRLLVNYRDSRLTRILSNSLGGNTLTSIICTASPAVLKATQSTLL